MITEMRTALVSDLAPLVGLGVQVHPPFPDRVAPPAAVVGYEDGRFVQPADPPIPGSFEVLFKVTILVGRGTDRLDLLDAFVDTVLQKTSGNWAFRGVDEPVPFTENGMELLGCVIHLARQGEV